MAKKSTRLMHRVYTVFPLPSRVLLGIAVALVLCFIVLQPRVLNTLLPWARHHTLQNYIKTVQREGQLSPRTYWKFRERYSLGSFSFDPEVVSFGETQVITALPKQQTALLYYTSDHLRSTDYIVKIPKESIPTETEKLLRERTLDITLDSQNWRELFHDGRSKILTDDNGKYLIVFVRSIDEMRTANGFFDFVDAEQKLLTDTVWLNVTQIYDN